MQWKEQNLILYQASYVFTFQTCLQPQKYYLVEVSILCFSSAEITRVFLLISLKNLLSIFRLPANSQSKPTRSRKIWRVKILDELAW